MNIGGAEASPLGLQSQYCCAATPHPTRLERLARRHTQPHHIATLRAAALALRYDSNDGGKAHG
jgi:hypothetical protein